MESIREIRNRIGLTQEEAAKATKLSLRSFADYERDESKKDTPKYKYIVMELMNLYPLDESHGILTTKDIKERIGKVFNRYDVSFCILFGPYANEAATETSDVDLLIPSDENQVELEEELRKVLHKKTHIVSLDKLKDDPKLLEDICRYGVRIYE